MGPQAAWCSLIFLCLCYNVLVYFSASSQYLASCAFYVACNLCLLVISYLSFWPPFTVLNLIHEGYNFNTNVNGNIILSIAFDKRYLMPKILGVLLVYGSRGIKSQLQIYCLIHVCVSVSVCQCVCVFMANRWVLDDYLGDWFFCLSSHQLPIVLHLQVGHWDVSPLHVGMWTDVIAWVEFGQPYWWNFMRADGPQRWHHLKADILVIAFGAYSLSIVIQSTLMQSFRC